MIYYLLLNAAGEIVQRGNCPTEEEIPVVPGMTHQIVQPGDKRRPRERLLTARQRRMIDYPDVGDQLEAMWLILDEAKLIKPGSDAAKLINRINAVKAANPKDTTP